MIVYLGSIIVTGSKLIGSEFRGLLVAFALLVLVALQVDEVTAQPQYVQNRPSAAIGFAQEKQVMVRVQCSTSYLVLKKL